jgi:hypothetical protein
MRKVIILIAPNATTKVEAEGFTGPGCTEATLPFLTRLGRTTKHTIKPEMYQSEAAQYEKETQ